MDFGIVLRSMYKGIGRRGGFIASGLQQVFVVFAELNLHPSFAGHAGQRGLDRSGSPSSDESRFQVYRMP